MTAPTDSVLVETIAATTGESVVLHDRRPYAYATSAVLEELTVTIGGDERALIVKHLSWDGLFGDARTSKQTWLHEPRRELGAYQALAGHDVTPQFYGGVADGEAWVAMDKVDGVELWKVGDVSVWRAVAGWLTRFHDRFEGRLDDLAAGNPHLVRYDGQWVASWAERGLRAVERSGDSRAEALGAVLRHDDVIVGEWDALPVGLVHGELYPSNVLVGPGDHPVADTVMVRPIDWEMAGTGPGALDLAALSSGWDAGEREALIATYEGTMAAPRRTLRREVDLARLHLALRWVGWAADWAPPAEHASDWVGEALSAAADLGLQ